MDYTTLRSVIENHIEQASDALNDSTMWWETQYDNAGSLPNRKIDILLNNIMEAIDEYADDRYNEGVHDGAENPYC